MNKIQIDDLFKRCVFAELDGVTDFLVKFDDETLAREFNGIGPEWAGEIIRDKVSQHCALFSPAALIHDMRNYMSDGSEVAFHAANDEFHRNCLKLADRQYRLWDWRRYRAYAVAHFFYDLVDGAGGWKAWLACYEKNKERNK